MNKSIRFKKTMTMIITLLLLVSSVPSFAAGPSFKDVSRDFWGYKYIEDMVELGYLNGYPNGTFVPKGNLNLMEAISTLARFTEPTSSEKTNAVNGYGYLFNELKIEQDWEKEGLAVALDKEILTEEEVRDSKNKDLLKKPINRERVAELLAKAMGLEKEAKSIDIVVVDYVDILKTDSSRRKYLRVLLDADVLDPMGKGEKDFQPKANLSRAEMATLLSKAAVSSKRNPIEPEVVEYEYITDVIKRITKDAGTMLVIENSPDREKSYRIEDKTTINVDGKTASESSLAPGQEVRLKIVKGSITIVSMEAFSAEESFVGVAKTVSTKDNKITFEYRKDKEILSKDFYVDTNAKINLDEKLSSLKNIKDGDLVEIKVRNNSISEIEAFSKTKKIRGIIKEITPVKDGKDTFYQISVEDKDKVMHKFITDSKTDIRRKDLRAGGQDLKVKDDVYIDGDYNIVTDLYTAYVVDADVVKRKVKGQVTETVKRLNKNTLVSIKNQETGEEESYDLSSNVDIIIDGVKSVSLPSDPGYYAELELENDDIVEIYVDSKRAEDSITGRIVDVNYRERTLVLQDNSFNFGLGNNNELIIYIKKETSFLKENSTIGSLEDFKIGDNATVIGVYRGMNFEANLIIKR